MIEKSGGTEYGMDWDAQDELDLENRLTDTGYTPGDLEPPAAPDLLGVHWAGEGEGEPEGLYWGGAEPEGIFGPCAAVWAPGAGQDHPGGDCGQRDGREPAGDGRAGY